MILAGLALIGGTTTYCFSQGQGDTAPATAETPAEPAAAPTVTPEQAKKIFSYYIGYSFGQQASAGATTLSIADFDKDTFFQALDDSLSNKTPALSTPEIEAGMKAFVTALQEREKIKAEENLTKGKDFQENFSKQEGVTKTESGLLYRIVTPAEGRKYDPAQDGESALCSITYEGKLIDGTVFDKCDSPIDMQIDRVVPGFSEALKLMPIGSTWEVCIPSELAYGPQGPGPIGNNSTLIFTISLKDIKKAPAPTGMPMQLTPEMLQQLQQQGLQNTPE